MPARVALARDPRDAPSRAAVAIAQDAGLALRGLVLLAGCGGCTSAAKVVAAIAAKT